MYFVLVVVVLIEKISYNVSSKYSFHSNCLFRRVNCNSNQLWYLQYCSPIRIFLLPPSEWGLRRSNIGLVGFQLYCIVVVFSHTLTFLSTITFILSVSRSVRGNVTFSNFHINTPPKSYRIILYNRIIFYWTSAVGIYVLAYHICIWN